MSEQVLNSFSSIQFLATIYARHAGLYSGAALCLCDVINTIALSAQFVGRNTPAIYSRMFSAPLPPSSPMSTMQSTAH